MKPWRRLPHRLAAYLSRLGRRIYPAAAAAAAAAANFELQPAASGATTMRKNELSWAMGYLAALIGVFWFARMVGAHVHLVHAV
jgi:hypothetical protein